MSKGCGRRKTFSAYTASSAKLAAAFPKDVGSALTRVRTRSDGHLRKTKDLCRSNARVRWWSHVESGRIL